MYPPQRDSCHSLIKSFVEEHRGVGEVKQDSETGEGIIVAAEIPKLPQYEWGVLIGDAVHNIRSALDHVVWELSVEQSGPTPDPINHKWKRIRYPIIGDSTKYSARERRGEPAPDSGIRCTWAIRRDLDALIKKTQPFTSGKHFKKHPLFVLEELWNADKHRTLHLATYGAQVRVTAPGAQIKLRKVFKGGHLENGTELYRFSVHPKFHPAFQGREIRKVKVKVEVTLGVAFEQGPPAYGGGVVDTLQYLSRHARDIVKTLRVASAQGALV
jgi:hypothetical protein